MKLARLLFVSLIGWPLGLVVESVLLACWPLSEVECDV